MISVNEERLYMRIRRDIKLMAVFATIGVTSFSFAWMAFWLDRSI